ncbi:MAG: His/Gly/Thr/Pro-type tRNA ligase C-terminal domain-containing protein, partial [Pyrinomonadaceae bacterium]
ELKSSNIRAEIDDRSETMQAKIRDAQMQKVPYMLVLGDKELDDQTVAVRERKQGDIGAMSMERFKELITQQKLRRSL